MVKVSCIATSIRETSSLRSIIRSMRLSEDEVQSELDAIENQYKADGVRVQRVDGQALTNGEPDYLLEPIPLDGKVSSTTLPPELRIILTDFGASCRFEKSNDGFHTYSILLQAPEVILKHPLDEKADIWNVRCIIFEIMLAARPFDAWSIFGMEEQTLNELLCAIVERLGPLPQRFRSHLTRPPKMTELIESNPDEVWFCMVRNGTVIFVRLVDHLRR